MNRFFPLVLGVALAASAQAQGPAITEAKQAYSAIKNNLTKMADVMSEENYAFKPTPEIRTFGQLVAHVADAQLRTCSAVKSGEPKAATAGNMTSKADLVAALKASFAECDAAFEMITDANANEIVKAARNRSRLGALIGNTTHSNEEYGYMAVYLRLKGVVPPSSAGR